MYLKKLEMIGFKSFAESTTVTFQPGITAIVGPNGCGKSNIVDAILWVLGEQSTKSLRSDRMEDLLFNGSETRRPLNLSEVVLTVGDVSGEVAGQFGEFQEIAISRRLFRTGESEYLINKIPCRLKDIRDLLIDTGAGHKGHTIIEQGKVDQLLNASPLERRELIEETAGISKYKLRKAEAERKLDATHQNLLRVRDIIGEVKRQIHALDRQVKKTETYQALQAEARGLELNLLVSEYQTHRRALSDVLARVEDLKTGESSLRADLSRADAEAQTLKTALIEKEAVLASIQQSVYDTQALIHRQENRIELLRGQIRSWEEHRDKLIQEQARLDQSLAQSAAHLDETLRQQEETAGTLSDRRRRLAELETALTEADEELARLETALEENKARLFEIMALLTEVKNQTAALESRKKEIQRIQEKGRSELSTVEQQIGQTERDLESERSLYNGLTNEQRRIETEQSRLAETLGLQRAEIESLTERIFREKETITLAGARRASLLENEKSLTTEQAGIRSLLSEHPELNGRLHGIVADLIDVPKIYEPAIEAVLGEQLQGLLLDDHASIKDIIDRLKSSDQGRGLFLPRTPRSKTGPAFQNREGVAGVVGPALDRVVVKAGYEAVARTLLGHVVLVQNLDAALEIWNQNPAEDSGITLVTLEGDLLLPSGLIWGGRRTESQQGLLKTRRELREIDEDLRQLQAGLTQAEAAKARSDADLDQLERARQELLSDQNRIESDAADRRQTIALLEADRARLNERRDLLQHEHRQEAQEAFTTDQSLAETLRQINVHLKTQDAIETERIRLQEAAKDLSEKRDRLRSEATQLKVDVSSLIEREEALSRERLRLKDEQVSLKEQQQRLAVEAANLEAKGRSALQDIRETEAAIGGLAAQLSEARQRLSVQTESCSTDLDQLKQIENRQGLSRTELERVEKLLNESELRQTELRMRLSHLAEQASARYRTELSSLTEESGGPADTVGIQERLNELQAKLEQLGPVNLAAIDEYKELDERYRFLTAQEADLNQSIEDMQSAISKINRTTREMFFSTYTALREKFREVYQGFFTGGQADLILLDEHNPLESGIEIMAQPPGKRLKSITLLSGGEKALTAIALLFASFLIHPSPFCVLDEIDAPLDEENIRRFLKVLREMTDHSQFLIITHNKRTMEHADLLYGVTMEEAGVSKLVSVKLESNGNAYTAVKPAATLAAETSPTATV